jgi:hypothetical protein
MEDVPMFLYVWECHKAVCAISVFQRMLFADELKIRLFVKPAEDGNLLQSDIDSMQTWYIGNYMLRVSDFTRLWTGNLIYWTLADRHYN